MPPSFLWRHGEGAVKSLVFHQPWSALRLLGGKSEAARTGISCGRGSCAHGLPFWIHELLWFEIWGHSNLKSRNWCWCLGDPKGLKFPQARFLHLLQVWCRVLALPAGGEMVQRSIRIWEMCVFFTCICMYIHTYICIYIIRVYSDSSIVVKKECLSQALWSVKHLWSFFVITCRIQVTGQVTFLPFFAPCINPDGILWTWVFSKEAQASGQQVNRWDPEIVSRRTLTVFRFRCQIER